MSLSELRKELKELRKEHVKPVSRMKKGDIAAELEKLRERRETVPPVAATEGAPSAKMAPKKSNVKVSKEKEHPVAPVAAPKPAKKGMSKAMMRAMLDEMTSDEE